MPWSLGVARLKIDEGHWRQICAFDTEKKSPAKPPASTRGVCIWKALSYYVVRDSVYRGSLYGRKRFFADLREMRGDRRTNFTLILPKTFDTV